jgi:TolA-binding protein
VCSRSFICIILLASSVSNSCRGSDDPATGHDAEGERLRDIAEAFAAGDCALVDELAPGFTTHSQKRYRAVTTMVGRCRYDAGDFPAAAKILGPVASAFDENDIYARDASYYYGRSVYRDGQFQEAARALGEFADRYGMDSRRDDARYFQGRAFEQMGELEDALRVFGLVIADAQALPARLAGAHFHTAEVLRAKAALDPIQEDQLLGEAYDLYLLVLEAYPASTYADDSAYRIGRMLFDRAHASTSPADSFALYSESADAMEAFLEQFPDSILRAGGLYFLGRDRYELTEYDAAQAPLDEAAGYEKSTWLDNALYYAGMTRYRLGATLGSQSYLAGIARFDELLDQCSASEYRDNAAYFRARCLMKIPSWHDAEAALEAFLAEFPGSTYEDNARYQLIVVRIALGDCSGALTALSELQEMQPPSTYVPKGQALYQSKCGGA